MTTEEKNLYTVGEIAKKLRVDDTTVRRWIKNGTLHAVELPHQGNRRSYRVHQTTIESLLQQPVTTE